MPAYVLAPENVQSIGQIVCVPGRHKVMFGTDFPVLTFERYRREVDDLGLRAESYKAFIRGNAERVFKL